MTYVNHGATRVMALLLTMIALALTSYSATAQQKKPALQKEPEKVEEQKPAAPDKPAPLRRLPADRAGIPDWTPQAAKLREVDCSGTETVQFLPIDVYPLLPVRGDTEIGGSPDFELSATVKHTAGRILLSGYVTLTEPERGGAFSSHSNTMYKGNFTFDSIVLKPGCEIDNVTPSKGEISDWSNYHHNWEMLYGAKLIESANCRQDTGGDDEGKVGCKSIKLRPIEVSFRKMDKSRICDAVAIKPRFGVIFPLSTNRGGPHGKDMNGNRVDVFLDSHVDISNTPDGMGQELSLSSNLKMSAVQKNKGRAMRVYGEGGQRNIFLTAFDAPGCRIVEVRPSTGTLRAKSSAGEHRSIEYGAGSRGEASGMIDYAICRTDTSGEDSGKIGCTEVAYKPLTIILEKQ